MLHNNLQENHTSTPLLHQRQLEGISSQYVFHWHGKRLKGCYLIKHQLSTPLTTHSDSKPTEILLIPGIFDPVRGEYGEDTLKQLLAARNITKVYELHFFSAEQSGLLNIDALMQDLQFIFSHGSHLKAVSLSAGSVFTAVALFNLHEHRIKPTLTNALLLGPHIVNYETLFYRWALKAVHSPDMMAKVTRHAGHSHVPANVAMTETWCAKADFTQAIRTFPIHRKRPGFPVKVETRYFRFDTLARAGRKRLHWYFDCPKPQKPMRGLHRGLFRVPESTKIICDFCCRSE